MAKDAKTKDSNELPTRVKPLKTDSPNELPPVTHQPATTKLPNGIVRTDY